VVRLDKWVAAEDDLVGLEITWLERCRPATDAPTAA
jgi:hypothetical protein